MPDDAMRFTAKGSAFRRGVSPRVSVPSGRSSGPPLAASGPERYASACVVGHSLGWLY